MKTPRTNENNCDILGLSISKYDHEFFSDFRFCPATTEPNSSPEETWSKK